MCDGILRVSDDPININLGDINFSAKRKDVENLESIWQERARAGIKDFEICTNRTIKKLQRRLLIEYFWGTHKVEAEGVKDRSFVRACLTAWGIPVEAWPFDLRACVVMEDCQPKTQTVEIAKAVEYQVAWAIPAADYIADVAVQIIDEATKPLKKTPPRPYLPMLGILIPQADRFLFSSQVEQFYAANGVCSSEALARIAAHLKQRLPDMAVSVDARGHVLIDVKRA